MTLKLTCWNVNGLFKRSQSYSKLKDEAFLQRIEKFDIIGIIETHCDPNDILVLDGYCTISYCRPKSQLACKPSGGISVFIRKSLKSGIKVAKISEYSIWLKLSKSSFQLDKDIFIAFSYLPPENSSFSRSNDNDILDLLERDVTNFSKHGDLIIMGDLNARTSCENEIILNDSSEFLPDYLNYQPDISIPKRFNQDLELNNRGKDLIDLCTTASLRILNGRKPGDSLGHFTCFKYNGSSTVDYGICSEFLFPSILYFHVSPLLGDLADHCQISLGLKVNQLFLAPQNKVLLTELPPRFKWCADSTYDFQLALCNSDIQARLNEFEMTNFNVGVHDIDKATALLNDIIISAASQSLKMPPTKNKSHARRTKSCRWFNFDLRKLRREVFSLSRMMCMYPRDPQIRGCYYRLLKIYRKKCKSEHRKFKADLMDSLDKLSSENPSAYWKLVNELTEKRKETLPIDPDLFYDHYLQLNSETVNQNTASDKAILAEASALELTRNFSNLDFLFKPEEIEKVVKSLKGGKSSGTDQIQNEMIKAGLHILIKPMTKLFNLVFSSGNYPSLWATGRIISIHKKGDTSDPGNYRGITISSCLGKIFNSVLNNRLCNYLECNNIISEEQIGFRKKHRTSDHLFILKTLIDKYKNSKQKLYIGFIDFMKAFDSVWHTGLLYKILKIGVSNAFFKIVKSMYSKILVAIQVGNSISPNFPSMVGIRQGNNLSPSLFNIFINDLPQIFDDDCTPASFGNMKLSCLLFADDLVVLSENRDGFQRAMDKLSEYCSKWHLTVNSSKTKYMCTDKNHGPVITYNGLPLECVQSYKYLGLECYNNGNMSEMRKDAYKRALKVYFKLTKSFNPLPRSSTLIHLFDHLVKPVLNYNCEIWFPKNLEFRTCKVPESDAASFFYHLKLQHPIPSKLLSNQDPMEKLHTRFLKFCLGLNRRASNMAVYGDLGRYPLYIDQCVQSLNYIYYIEHETNNKILKRFYSNVTLSARTGKASILHFSKKLQEMTGIHMFANRRKSFQFLLRKSLQTDFSLYWKQLITTNYSKTCSKGSNKLRTYKTFKTIFKQEKYTDLDFRLRKQIALLRSSSHKLKIETDRYLGREKYIPPDQRLCTNCDLQATEDEMHFLLDCSAHTGRRLTLFKTLSSNPHFAQYNRGDKFWWIMNTEDPEGMKQLGTFIMDSMAARV